MAEPFNGGDQTALPADAEVFVTRDGQRGTIPRAELEDYQRHGWALETPEATTDARMVQEYGDRPGAAALQGAASTLTFGGSDVALGAWDPEGARETEKQNEGAYLGGAIGGAVLGGGVGLGGAVTGAGRVVEAGVAEAAGGGLGARLLGAGARGATEGLAYGAGSGVSDVALSEDPVTWEGAAATIGSDALGGAVFGAGIGVGGKLLEEGAIAAKRTAAAKLEQMRAAPNAEADARAAFPEVAGMDKKAAREYLAEAKEEARAQRATDLVEGKAARQAEVDTLERGKDAAAADLHKDALEYKDFLRSDPAGFVVTDDPELKAILTRSKRQIMSGLDNVEGFVTKRGSAGVLDGLQKQKGALTRVLADADEVIANAGAARQGLLDELPTAVRPGVAEPIPMWHEFKGTPEEYGALKAAHKAATEPGLYLNPEASKLYSKWSGVAIPEGQSALAVSAENLAGFRDAIESGAINPSKLQHVLDAQQLLQRNQTLLDKFAALKAPVASPALDAIDAKLESARAGVGKTPKIEAIEAHIADLGETSLGKKMAKHVAGAAGGALGFHVGGFVGAMAGHEIGADFGAKVYDRLVKKISAGNALRAKSIAASVGLLFASGAQKTAQAVQRVAPVASRILPAISYAQKKDVDGTLGPDRSQPSKNQAVNDFRQRARELNSITERQPDGTFTMRMSARQVLGARLQALWAVAPGVANGVEKTHAARVAFLSSKLPRDPSPPHLQAGPDTWEPSHAELAKFARYMEAVEYPERVVQRMSTSTMTPEDAEVLKTVYPGLYADVQNQCMAHIAELRETLPYARRLSLSIYLDRPLDAALTPEALSVYQRPAPPPDSTGGARKQGPATQMPEGQSAPTRAQRFST